MQLYITSSAYISQMIDFCGNTILMDILYEKLFLEYIRDRNDDVVDGIEAPNLIAGQDAMPRVRDDMANQMFTPCLL